MLKCFHYGDIMEHQSHLRSLVHEYANEVDEELLLADGFDDAIIGVGFSGGNHRVVYDKNKMLQILVDRDSMTDEEANEYLEHNVLSTYIGEHTPMYMDIF